ncbi:MAG: adenylate kinase [Acidobacteriota bacterium]
MSEMRPAKDQRAIGSAAGSGPCNVVLVGLPGSGKGTQGSQFARRHGIPKISTGDMLREAVARGTALGREVEATLAAGGLVPDDLIIRVVEDRLRLPDTAGGFVLDGFPRTLPQAVALDGIMAGRGMLIVIYLEVSPDVIIKRILSRRICESCGQADTGAPTTEYCASCGGAFVKRADDHVDVIKRRVAAYVENTAPLVEWYRKGPAFRAIDGNRPLPEVAAAFDAAVLDCLNKRGHSYLR